MLRSIMNHPVSKLRELLPDQWKPLPKEEHRMMMESAGAGDYTLRFTRYVKEHDCTAHACRDRIPFINAVQGG